MMTTEADRLTAMEVKLDGFIEETRSRFNDMNANMNNRFTDMNDRFNDIENQLNDMNNRLTRIENRLNAQLAISLVNLIGVGALLTLIVKS